MVWGAAEFNTSSFKSCTAKPKFQPPPPNSQQNKLAIGGETALVQCPQRWLELQVSGGPT